MRPPENGLPPPSQQQQQPQQQGLAPPQMSQPSISQHNSASQYLQAPTLQYEQPPTMLGRQSPSEQAAAALQIDPRLMGGPAPLANPGPVQIADLKDESQNEAKENSKTTSASQVPTITSLVNGSAATPNAEKTDTAESTSEEADGASPSGTKQTTSIQDIPSEKLGFREDKRALRQLDKVFAV
jgi:Gti1/Pac2 family transcription factor